MLAIKNGNIITVTKGFIKDGTILVEDGKITKVGQNIEVPNGAEVIDAKGRYVIPGMIDAHTNIGLKEGSLRWEGSDHVEKTEAVVPQLRAIDGVNPFDVAIKDAVANGITTTLIAPGDDNTIGGLGSVFKLKGITADQMFVKDACVKIALGENAKNIFDRKKMPSTRMGTAYLLRKAFYDAKQYEKELKEKEEKPDKKVKRDLKSEMLLKVLNHELPLHVHAHRADDIMTAIRIAKEFDVKMVLVHGYEADKVAKELYDNNIAVIYGPILNARTQVETANLNMKTPKLLSEAKVELALTTAHPAKPIAILPTCAALAIREGLNVCTAINAITITPAKLLGVDDRVGSIEVGKDADIVIFNGHPLQVTSTVEKTLINGEVVYTKED
ncbi:MAG: amidohydrolase [Clostridia bacterium]